MNRSPVRRRLGLLLLLAAVACNSENSPVESVVIVRDGHSQLTIVYAQGVGTGVEEAASSVSETLGQMTGADAPAVKAVAPGFDLSGLETEAVLVLGSGVVNGEPLSRSDLEALALGDEGYLLRGGRHGGKTLLQVGALHATGIQYGAFDLLRRQGVRYLHPEETFIPALEQQTLELGDPAPQLPGFPRRGFHQHTQHPIPMSVYLLEPAEDHLPWVKRYLQWLVHNRQNYLSWQMLNTVDLTSWVPYMKQISELAADYGISLSMVVSFADNQQNSFKLIPDVAAAAEVQNAAIRDALDQLSAAGLSEICFQIGSSEFVRYHDEEVLRWLDTAAAQLEQLGLKGFAWIHVTGELKADDGKSYFYHLPERADSRMGAWVHTTMFYDMANPAPVYGNSDFSHQRSFLERNLGKRDVVYFPETAWWLGFDNNLPLALPITGHSRALDILEVLKDRDLQGHVTFSTGLEWGYWKYDHALTRITWDRKTGWRDYLTDISPIFDEAAAAVAKTLTEWTDQQVADFYDDRPEMLFYLSGELPEDELGQAIGIMARPPKRAFKEIVNLPEEEFTTWEQEELGRLKTMQDRYGALLQQLPEALPQGASSHSSRLFKELHTTLLIYTWRIEHTRLLYEAVQAARQGREDGGVGADADAGKRSQARQQAEASLTQARAVTLKVKAAVAEMEQQVYRYPLKILAEERESLTSYPYGYLHQTSTAFFWTRREDQLAKLLALVSGQLKEEWSAPPPQLIYYAKKDDVVVQEPNDPLMQQVLGAFIPGLLVAAPDDNAAEGPVAAAWRLAIDHNDNQLPDLDTIHTIASATIENGSYLGDIGHFLVPVIDPTGREAGKIDITNAAVTLVLERQNNTLNGIQSGNIKGEVLMDNLLAVAGQFAGLDKQAVLALLGSVLGFDPNNPPNTIPFQVGLQALSPLP